MNQKILKVNNKIVRTFLNKIEPNTRTHTIIRVLKSGTAETAQGTKFKIDDNGSIIMLGSKSYKGGGYNGYRYELVTTETI